MEGCSNTTTLGHLLSNCKKMLDRYTFRHDSCLNLIYTTCKNNILNNIDLFADPKDCRVNGRKLPRDVVLTSSRPGLVLLDRAASPPKLYLVELTMTWDTVPNTEAARNRKQARYEHLSSDIEENGYKCFNTPLEVGVRGYISPRNRETIVPFSWQHSYKIYLARNSQNWSSGRLLKPEQPHHGHMQSYDYSFSPLLYLYPPVFI